jgi:hypothetical protein
MRIVRAAAASTVSLAMASRSFRTAIAVGSTTASPGRGGSSPVRGPRWDLKDVASRKRRMTATCGSVQRATRVSPPVKQDTTWSHPPSRRLLATSSGRTAKRLSAPSAEAQSGCRACCSSGVARESRLRATSSCSSSALSDTSAPAASCRRCDKAGPASIRLLGRAHCGLWRRHGGTSAPSRQTPLSQDTRMLAKTVVAARPVAPAGPARTKLGLGQAAPLRAGFAPCRTDTRRCVMQGARKSRARGLWEGRVELQGMSGSCPSLTPALFPGAAQCVLARSLAALRHGS